MKSRLLTLLATIALACAVLVPITHGSQAPQQPAPKPAAKPAAKLAEKSEHPHITAAVHLLEAAKRQLSEGTPTYGGHRVEAIKHVDAALAECKAAFEYAEKNEKH